MGQSNIELGNNNKITWRRNKVFELSAKGYSQAEISRTLQISDSTISRDIEYLREQSKKEIQEHIQHKLPLEYKKCIAGLEDIIKQAYSIAENGNTKDKLSSLALIKDTYNTKMDLLTNASLLNDSIKFVEQNKDKVTGIPKNLGNPVNKDNDIQGSTEDNSDQSTEEQFNTIF